MYSSQAAASHSPQSLSLKTPSEYSGSSEYVDNTGRLGTEEDDVAAEDSEEGEEGEEEEGGDVDGEDNEDGEEEEDNDDDDEEEEEWKVM